MRPLALVAVEMLETPLADRPCDRLVEFEFEVAEVEFTVLATVDWLMTVPLVVVAVKLDVEGSPERERPEYDLLRSDAEGVLKLTSRTLRPPPVPTAAGAGKTEGCARPNRALLLSSRM